jgi:hypothetical protein
MFSRYRKRELSVQRVALFLFNKALTQAKIVMYFYRSFTRS